LPADDTGLRVEGIVWWNGHLDVVAQNVCVDDRYDLGICARGGTMTTTTSRVGQTRQLLTELPGPKSRELHARRQAAVSSGLTTGFPVYIDRAEGAILVDVDGNHLLDLGSGIAVTSIGHAVPALVNAVSEQVSRFTHTCFMVTPYEEYVAVCEELNALTPGDFDKTSALFNSGAEAVENAVKIARLATGKSAIVAVEHAYHGRTNLTMALTAKNMPYKDRFGPFAPEVYRVPTSYPYRDQLDGPAAAARAIAQIESEVGAANLAAILIEPIQGEGGFIIPAEGFLPALAAWASDKGVVLIADEIQTGFCRTGAWFAMEHEGVVPDLVTTAKGLAGGMPLAAVTGRRELMNAVHEGGLGGTYGGNPVAAAAALASIATMRELDLCARARAIGDTVLARLRDLARDTVIIGDVRGRGAMIAIELVDPGTTTPNPAAARAIVAECTQNGCVVITCGTYGNVVRLLPPLVITDAQLADGLDVLTAAVRAAG
jgi:4-aminobutyrate aminotransferase / (S)-3-amino-2-methylpropionate transaminase / 5-aminovalerate transaminase